VSKRRIEYRLAALLTINALFMSLAATILQTLTRAWSVGWLDLPFGTWIHALCGGFVLLFAAAFLRACQCGLALAGLLASTVMAVGFIPGANVCLSDLLLDSTGLIGKLTLLFSLLPIGIASATWWEFSKWKQVPGDSGGVRLSLGESKLAGVMESLSTVVNSLIDYGFQSRKQK